MGTVGVPVCPCWCQVCDDPVLSPDDAVLVGHVEGGSGPGWDIWAHRAHTEGPRPGPGAALRSLLEETAFTTAVATVTQEAADLNEARAARIVDETLAFLATCAARPGEHLRPSHAVDTGWRALLLHTGTYHGLCARLGAFVHRRPDPPGLITAIRDPLHRRKALHRTQGLMTGAGHDPDPLLWLRTADCVGGAEWASGEARFGCASRSRPY